MSNAITISSGIWFVANLTNGPMFWALLRILGKFMEYFFFFINSDSQNFTDHKHQANVSSTNEVAAILHQDQLIIYAAEFFLGAIKSYSNSKHNTIFNICQNHWCNLTLAINLHSSVYMILDSMLNHLTCETRIFFSARIVFTIQDCMESNCYNIMPCTTAHSDIFMSIVPFLCCFTIDSWNAI